MSGILFVYLLVSLSPSKHSFAHTCYKILESKIPGVGGRWEGDSRHSDTISQIDSGEKTWSSEI